MKKQIITLVAVLASFVLMAQPRGGEKIRQVQQQFITAVETNNPTSAIEILKKNPRLKKLSYNGEPIMHYLMLDKNSEDIITYLIQSGIDIYAKDNNGYNCVEFLLVNVYSNQRLSQYYYKNLTPLIRNGYNIFEPILLNFSFDKTCTWSRYNSNSESYEYYDTIISTQVKINHSLFYEIWDEHDIRNISDDGYLLKSHQEAIMDNIQHNKYPDIPDNKGYTPLAYFLTNELPEASVWLINNGASADIRVPEYRGIHSVSPIFCAILTPNAQNLVEVLIKKGAEIQEIFDNLSAIGFLYYMISKGAPEAQQCLGNLLPIVNSNYSVFSSETYYVTSTAQISRLNEFGEIVSYDTSFLNTYSTSIYEFLNLSNFNDYQEIYIDTNAMAALRSAVLNNLSTNKNLYSVPDREGKFPIHYLAENETDSLFAYALNPDITEIQQVDSNGFTPIHYAAKKTNGYEMVEYLLNHKADINAKIPDITYREELYELYFEHDNKTYFRFNKRIWSDFFRSPENWYIQYHGCTPLHLACSVPNNLDVVKIFVENGADINAIHQIIGTPLHVAISYGSDLELIRYLVENGANLNIKNYAGMTPAEFAKNLNANETYKYLKEIGGK